MCGTCGCNQPLKPSAQPGAVQPGAVQPGAAQPGAVQTQTIEWRRLTVERDLLGRNDQFAEQNRHWLKQRNSLAINILSSPGSGKTTLLVKTIEALGDQLPIQVIEGDQQTELDAERIRSAGANAIQINTGKGCHLEAERVGEALRTLDTPAGSLVLIENVGNLVCPAGFDLGESFRIVLLSVTEGSDKPLKYPDVFENADLLVITKTDLLPYVDFDIHQCEEFARRIRPNLPTLHLSARTGEGCEAWYQWLTTRT